MAPGQRIGDVDGVAAELSLGVALDIAQLAHVVKVEHRLAHLQAHRRVDLVDVKQVGLGADERHQAHHDGLANRVDRRVGHLGEQLLEIVVKRLVLVGQHGQRAVIAHRANALFAGTGHGCDQELEVFLGETKSLLAVEQADAVGLAFGQDSCGQIGACAIQGALHQGQVVELDAQVLDPLLVGLAVGQVGLDFLIVDHATLLQIDQEHLAGLQAPFADDFVLRHGQNPRLGAHDDQVVVGDAVARGAQAVAVQRGADLAAIGEDNAGRAIPRLQHGGMVLIEGSAALVHAAVLLPGLGDHHHHRLADRVAGHGQQFQAVVKSGGVGLAGETDRVELLQVGAEHRRRHHAFPGLHPVVVALDGVDLTVVRHIAVGVSQRPLWKGVGGETLVHQTQCRHAALILQVKIVGAHLIGQQQTFVHHSAAGHAGNVVLVAVLQFEVLDGGTGCFANDIQLALEGILHDDIGTTTNENLLENWLFFAHGGRHGHVAVHGNIAPANQHLTLGFDSPLKFLFTSHAGGMFFRQEHHAHTVLALRRQSHALLGHLFSIERIRQLNQDTSTVAHQLVGTHRTPVVQVFQNLQRLRDDGMRLSAFDMSHKAHTTSVVFLSWVVQTRLLQS